MGYDAIVIGGGPNGLTTAALLGKAGRKVLVLERREILGGLAAREEFHPGFSTPGLLHDTTGVRRAVVDALQLGRHGLKWREKETPVFVPSTQGKGLLLHRFPEAARGEIETYSARDAERYRAWRAFLERIRGFWNRLVEEPAPELGAQSLFGLWDVGRKALALRRLGEKDMVELLRITPMCIADWLNEWFETPALKAALAATAIQGTWMGPWSPGTVVTFLLRELNPGLELDGGPAALTRALESAARAQGVEIRTRSPVLKIQLHGGRARGVELSKQERLEASLVVSSVDPRRTFLELMAPPELPPGLEASIRLWRTRGTTAVVRLALKKTPEYECRPGAIFELTRTGTHLDQLEKAFDAVKYGRFSAEPHLEVRIPSLTDPSLAPPGQQVGSVLVHFVPYELRGGWNEKEKEAVYAATMRTLSSYARGVQEEIVGFEVLSPRDLEERYGISGGQVHHGEPGLDQLFSLRPAPSCSRYVTPVPGLYLCGSGTHPGGGLSCTPGSLAATAILGA